MLVFFLRHFVPYFHYILSRMKKLLFVLLLLAILQKAGAQPLPGNPTAFDKAIKWAPVALSFGSISLHGEWHRPRHSYTFRLGIPVASRHAIDVFENSTSFQMKNFSLLAGYRKYLTGKPMKGPYLEPFLQYTRHLSKGTGQGNIGGRIMELAYNNRFSGGGAGIQFGLQFIVKKRVVLDFFLLGPLMNYASNEFLMQELGTTKPWTEKEIEDATKRINNFAAGKPFLRNHTTVNIDGANKKAATSFKGILPGLRTGISAGINF